MAIDSKVKRNSALLGEIIFPDGAIGAWDRQDLLGQYAFYSDVSHGADIEIDLNVHRTPTLNLYVDRERSKALYIDQGREMNLYVR